MTYIVSGGALNSTNSTQLISEMTHTNVSNAPQDTVHVISE